MAVRCENVRLAAYTTLRLGGPARRFIEADAESELVEAVRQADADGEPVLILGGGSNLVVADEGFAGTVVHVATRGVTCRTDPARPGKVLVTAQAGEEWEPFVARCVADGLAGLECLSGIPGRVGATPIQNVGAYGQDVSETIVRVRAYDRRTGEIVTLDNAACGFGYRTSVFKGRDRHVVLDVTFALEESDESQPIAYAELARTLGVSPGQRVPLHQARQAVLELRRGKGMVLDPDDPDTRSAGSFFTNPILDAAQLAELERRVAERLGPETTFPRYPEPDGRTKTSAAWLIDKAGFGKGHALGPVRISTKHTLALTNPDGTARTADLLALARQVRDGVREAFGIELVNEPVMVGVKL
ncbi:UDP-N-acetylmuramate dehydrogenase [Thermomonospora curvata]|uniref:UDP-N-acetylenolpyruvoylglucosamine reductase n=1 Tax=Thermomonospora curvata (strain ATCC 19995 / DSM 43183 / JCM 3096 / KCTC 9072 / NBRC 15933 / NCIMB 10081 / Henssen B9) TaxID=471852 RepID=D1A3B8_THECD|nr:UDP-N-acetylmuramate dehydrogenase [Thermomonospora curvata]ACY99888.1 UDP-N-acetylenolpyruvoylglucosamine reductase [Thermomonospora curvata DSM 43183]